MNPPGVDQNVRPIVARLAIFAIGAFAVFAGYYYLIFGMAVRTDSRAVSELLLLAIPIVICFVGTLVAGFWRKESGIVVRFVASILCFAIPAAAFLTLLELTWKCANPCVP